MSETVAIDRVVLVRALQCVISLRRVGGFDDIPSGLSPMFYQTLSEEGDREQGVVLTEIADRIRAALDAPQ